jgi:hypothetical protein
VEIALDTLKGNLELFGLEAIAGLLASARKTGALRVAVDGLNGRLFFVDGALVYATTRKLDGSVNDLRGRGIEVRERRRNWSLSLPELLRHQITDVIVRILRRSGGEFEFDEGVTTTALPPGRTLSFNASEMIHRAEERLEEWREIEEAIPDSSVKYRLTPDLPSDMFEVTVDARMWTFLAAVGDGASAGDIAERLRIFEFPAAQKMAEYVRRGMLVPLDAEVAAQALRDARATRSAFAPDETEAADEAVEAEPAQVRIVMVANADDGDAVDEPAGPAQSVETSTDHSVTSTDGDDTMDGGESEALIDAADEPAGDEMAADESPTDQPAEDVSADETDDRSTGGLYAVHDEPEMATDAVEDASALEPVAERAHDDFENAPLPQVPAPPPWGPPDPAGEAQG